MLGFPGWLAADFSRWQAHSGFLPHRQTGLNFVSWVQVAHKLLKLEVTSQTKLKEG